MRNQDIRPARAALSPDRADWLAVALLILGGIILGTEGMLQCNLLDLLFAQTPTVADGFEGLVGIAALYASGRIFLLRRQY
jgi:uncharacterized membrane protein YuzA (DUF378 family)